MGGFVTPFALCYVLIVGLGGTSLEGVFVGLTAGVTALATKSHVLLDLQLLDTRVAYVMMAGAPLADAASLVILAGLISVAEIGSVDVVTLATVTVKAGGFFAIASFAGLHVLPPLMRKVRQLDMGRTGVFLLLVVITLVFAEGAELTGMHGILGAFMAGLFMQEQLLGRSMATEVQHLIRDASIGLLAPIFFVTAGFDVTLDVFTTAPWLLAGVVVLAIVGKIVGTAAFYLPTGHGWREGLAIGAGMKGRGAIMVVIAVVGLSLGMVSQVLYSVLIITAVATTVMDPLLLRWGVSWLNKRGELVDEEERTGSLIVGAGPTARALASTLVRSEPVALVDNNAEHVAFAEAEEHTVINVNAPDEDVLAEAGAGRRYRVAACTPNDEVNALVAQLARAEALRNLMMRVSRQRVPEAAFTN